MTMDCAGFCRFDANHPCGNPYSTTGCPMFQAEHLSNNCAGTRRGCPKRIGHRCTVAVASSEMNLSTLIIYSHALNPNDYRLAFYLDLAGIKAVLRLPALESRGKYFTHHILMEAIEHGADRGALGLVARDDTVFDVESRIFAHSLHRAHKLTRQPFGDQFRRQARIHRHRNSLAARYGE